jgi:hypothetical protein
MPLIQKRLVETMMTLLGATLEEKFRRRNAAINAVAAYCNPRKGELLPDPEGGCLLEERVRR